MPVVLPAAKGVVPHTGPGPLPFNNWFLIQNSTWDTTFADAAGTSEVAVMTLAGSSGSYLISATGEVRTLSSINYKFGDDPADSSLRVFTIAGNWSTASESGDFAFNNGVDQDHLEGRWEDPLGNGGPWTGRRIPYEPLRFINP